MKTLSKLLLDLYRLAPGTQADAFQDQALDRLQSVFGFDSAFWATGVVHPGTGITAHTYHLYRQPTEMMASWLRINKRDELAFEAFRQQGMTVNAALCGPYWQSRFDQEGREHINRYGMAHSLNTIVAEPVLQIWTGLAFYRANPEQPFSEEERLLKQELMPHLSEAWNISRFAFLNSAHSNGTHASKAQAICDSKGVLYNADSRFADFMRSEWPDWTGPLLPTPMLAVLSSNSPRRYAGEHVVVTVENLNNMELVVAREICAVDRLSLRERDVAELFARGVDYKTIADSLHIAPATVRNHLQHIYAKLGITSKIELAQLMNSN